MTACDACLRRAMLIAMLAGRISGLLNRPRGRVAGLLGLPERDLLEVAGGPRAELVAQALSERDLDADRDAFERTGVTAVCRHSRHYPPPLEDLDDAPAVLFAVGRGDSAGVLERLSRLGGEPAVALVGTRTPSPYGREVAYALGRGLGAAGVPVVSGLALGIDATAHRGCLAGGGMPVAVLACGPDVAYPRRHRGLHEEVREHGLVLAELPPGTHPFRWSFPARNRIMAGLARMTVVVEAADPSGSLITSDFARDLGRSVAAVPGHVTSRVARGTNGLLRDGAVPITGPRDVLDELFGAGARPLPPPDGPSAPEPGEPLLRAVLHAAERHTLVAAIAADVGTTVGRARAALGRLESEGYLVRRDLGGWERALSPRDRAAYPGGP
ncbi:MAG TPA: DNA-processing protein DprA [Pseudonocardia sp.]|nr:DNA-processing protein DprA [Pseudonocardia sp.]